jgi:Ca2+-binding RTX toxin-like protein
VFFVAVSKTISFFADPGEGNNVTVSIANNGTLTISDSNSPIVLDSAGTAASVGFTGSGTNTITGGDLTKFTDLFFKLGDCDDVLTLREFAGDIDVEAGAGNDQVILNVPDGASISLEGENGNDTLRGGSGSDVLLGGDGDDVLNGGDGVDTVDGDSGDDLLNGDDGNDVLRGDSGNDTMDGGDGNDNLQGGSGRDSMYGGDGFDTLEGSTGNDTMDGGDGTDRIVETGLTSTAVVIATQFTTPDRGVDTLIDIEVAELHGSNANNSFNASAFPGRALLDGGAGNDVLIGSPGNDTLTGGPGTDKLTGGAGIDTVQETADVNFTLTNTTLTGTGSFGTDRLSSVEQATLTGDVADNVFNAQAFTLGNVSLNGGLGSDILRGGSGNDTLDGAAGDNTLFGNGGNDTLRSTGGNATVSGGAGDDSFQGGTANNFVLSETGNANYILTNTQLKGLGTDNLSAIDAIILTGGAGNNSFDVSAWTANVPLTLNGGGGSDTVIATNDTNMTLTNTLLTRLGFANITLQAIKHARLEGGASANTLDASAFTLGSVTLLGGAGNDTLKGGSGADLLDGGDDTDSLIGGPGADTLLNGESNTP